MTETNNTPALPDDTRTTEEAVTESTSTPKRRRNRTLLVASGSLLGALLLVGGGVALGAAIADEDEDDNWYETRDSSASLDAGRDTDGEPSGAAFADVGTSSAAELTKIIERAGAEADGEPAAIEANRDGSWDVKFVSTSGVETEVRVASDGTATVISTEAADPDDAAPRGTLDAETVEALVAAALAEVDGKIVDLEADDDDTTPYDVSVATGDRRTVDVHLNAELAVVATDTDD